MDDLNVRLMVTQTVRKKPCQVVPDIMPDEGVKPFELPPHRFPRPQLVLCRQGTIPLLPFAQNEPLMPDFRQIVKIARVPVEGQKVKAWNFSHIRIISADAG